MSVYSIGCHSASDVRPNNAFVIFPLCIEWKEITFDYLTCGLVAAQEICGMRCGMFGFGVDARGAQ